jgi:hypothetical protein
MEEDTTDIFRDGCCLLTIIKGPSPTQIPQASKDQKVDWHTRFTHSIFGSRLPALKVDWISNDHLTEIQISWIRQPESPPEFLEKLGLMIGLRTDFWTAVKLYQKDIVRGMTFLSPETVV